VGKTRKDHQDDQDVFRPIILKRLLDWGAMDWIDVAHGRDQWRALVITIMNLRDPYKFGEFLHS
jgi:hypothetical protein